MSKPEADALFGHVAYLVCSAGLCLQEAPRFGALRLLVGASRLIDDAQGVEGRNVDAFLKECKAAIEAKQGTMWEEYPSFVAFLDEITHRIAEEATRRQLALPADPLAVEPA
jgi:hypothetical protein